MKINQINNNLSFKTTVDSNFIREAEKYYVKRSLPVQFNKFRKIVNELDLYGSDNSIIFNYTTRIKDKNQYLLCLKNEDINKKQAVIMATSNRFYKLLNFFTSLNDKKIERYEQELVSK